MSKKQFDFPPRLDFNDVARMEWDAYVESQTTAFTHVPIRSPRACGATIVQLPSGRLTTIAIVDQIIALVATGDDVLAALEDPDPRAVIAGHCPSKTSTTRTTSSATSLESPP